MINFIIVNLNCIDCFGLDFLHLLFKCGNVKYEVVLVEQLRFHERSGHQWLRPILESEVELDPLPHRAQPHAGVEAAQGLHHWVRFAELSQQRVQVEGPPLALPVYGLLNLHVLERDQTAYHCIRLTCLSLLVLFRVVHLLSIGLEAERSPAATRLLSNTVPLDHLCKPDLDGFVQGLL